MNLLEFAIHQKLERDNKLLDYVAKNKPVPCSILEEGLEPLIASLVDERATMLNDNYAQMLQTYIPVTYQKGDANTYRVQGEVPDTVLESIQLVHNVSPNDAIAAMIAENEKTLQQHSTVTNVDLLESAQRLLHSPLPSVTPLMPAPSEPSYQSVQPSAYVPPVVDEQVLQEQIMEVEQEQKKAQQVLAQNVSQIDEIDTLPTVEEAMRERDGIEHTEEDAPNLKDALRDIYYTLIRDIKEAGLDTRLGLQL